MELYERTRFVVANSRSLAMFFPIPLEMKQAETRSGIPVANTVLIAVNVLLYLCQGPSGIRTVGPGSDVLNVVLYGFSHFGPWHLIFNMWALWVFGNPVNRRLGNGFYLLAYLGTIVAVGLFARLFLPVGLAGSSGAVFAVIIMALMLTPTSIIDVAYVAVFPLTLLIGLLKRPKYELNWILGWGIVSVPALWCLVLIPLMELLSFLWRAWYYGWAWSWTPGAHLLGMLCGVAVVLMLPKAVTMRRRSWVDGV
jgi:membrane associated rhomboid family serine protease